jgi:uncharacterized protein (DUF433 family)
MLTAQDEMLTPSEAAVVAGVTVREIHRVMDKHILPERFYAMKGGQRLHLAACPLAGFYFHAAKALTADERRLLIRRLADRIATGAAVNAVKTWRQSSGPADWTISDGFLTVSLWEFAAGADDRYAKLAQAREAVVEDPEILGGTPVIRGTRIPVYDVAASVAAGFPWERIRAAYSALDDRLIELAAVYAEANPPHGRPRRVVPGGNAKTISQHKVARRSSGRCSSE